MAVPIIIVIAISVWYFVDTRDAKGAIAFVFVGIVICAFLFSGRADVKKKKTKTEIINGKKVNMVLMRYIGYETYTTAFGNKKRRRVWKEKWVTDAQYREKKYRPYVTRPWEARFFD